MKMGSAIFVFVLGAICAFAIKGNLIPNVDLELIGFILMGAGLVGFLVALFFSFAKGKKVSEVKTGYDENGNQVTRRESDGFPGDNEI